MVDPSFVRRLSEIADEASRPVFLSLFADLSDPQHAKVLERRVKEISAEVDEPIRPLLVQAWESARKAYEDQAARDGTRGVAVFASPEHGLLEALGLGEPIETRLVADSSPYVRPLLSFLDEHEPFLLVLLDSENAAVYSFQAGHAKAQDEASTNLMRGHKKGGMSQARYQRHREGVKNQFYDDLADAVTALMKETGVQRILVAGPGQAKKEFVERLPDALQRAVFAIEDADFTDGPKDEALASRFLEIAATHAQEQAKKDLATLQATLRSTEKACVGAFDCLSHAQAGRVATLLVLRGHRVAAQKCEAHQTVFRPPATCPTCQGAGTTVDAINEAIEYVVQAGGQVEFVDDEPWLEGMGGVGAILRF